MESTENQLIYSRNVIELITVSNEVSLFLENASSLEKKDFIDRALKLLPLLYLKMSLTQKPDEQKEEDDLEAFVTEENYVAVKDGIALLLGGSDRYLTIPLGNTTQSEESMAGDISEDLADLYQDLKDFLLRYQIGNEDIMNDALLECINLFHEHWGVCLINAMNALHYAQYNAPKEEDEEEGKEHQHCTHQHCTCEDDHEHCEHEHCDCEDHTKNMRDMIFNHQKSNETEK